MRYGLWSLILRCCSFIPILGWLAGLVGLVFWIMHWQKINAYKKQLEQTAFQFAGNPYGQQYYQQAYGQYHQQPYPYQQQYYEQQHPHYPGSNSGPTDVHF